MFILHISYYNLDIVFHIDFSKISGALLVEKKRI